jgi:hypothetical protein
MRRRTQRKKVERSRRRSQFTSPRMDDREDMQRVSYSLELELDAGPGPVLKFLIGPLGREGNTLHSYVLGKPRMIDVRPG